MQLQVIED